MLLKRAFIALAIVAACWIVSPATASAHELITDTAGSTKAILHIEPGDDPVAGKPNTLLFIIQNHISSLQDYRVSLVIRDAQGTAQTVPVTATDTTASATYTFPSQGLYSLTLQAVPANPNGQTVQFDHSLRVAQGSNGSVKAASTTAPAKPSHKWGYIGFAAAACVPAIVIAISLALRKKD